MSVCLSVHPILSVTLVYCGQTVRRIKMKLSIQHAAHAYKILSYNHDAGIGRGLGPGRIVLDGYPAPLPNGHNLHLIFGPYLLWPNGCMD